MRHLGTVMTSLQLENHRKNGPLLRNGFSKRPWKNMERIGQCLQRRWEQDRLDKSRTTTMILRKPESFVRKRSLQGQRERLWKKRLMVPPHRHQYINLAVFCRRRRRRSIDHRRRICCCRLGYNRCSSSNSNLNNLSRRQAIIAQAQWS